MPSPPHGAPAAGTAGARDLTPRYFRPIVRLIRPFPDFDFPFIQPLRARAVASLNLAPGGRVLDAGCGPGGSLPYLVRAVGTSGQVVGVEISPEVAVNARRRVARHGWQNVQIVESAAQTVELQGSFDGLLMFAAPDVYASQVALDNLLPRLRPGARVAFFGAKTSRRRSGWILNPVLRAAFPRLSFPTTPVPDDEPWRLLAPRLQGLTIDELFFGWMFLASGSYQGPAGRP
jgi:demethylmenaquinone methyltransferase/2-methoxy-6-polyprenyl-1,4-benzoquinol methylase